MRAGELDRRITIQQPNVTRNETGEEVTTWADVATVWAKADPVDGDEGFQSDRRVNTSRMQFTIRYRPGVTAKMRVVYDGETFKIEDVREKNRREGLVLDCFAFDPTTGA